MASNPSPHSSATSFPAPLDLPTNGDNTIISFPTAADPSPRRPPDLSIHKPAPQHGNVHLSPTSPGVTSPTAETSAKPSAAHAAISQTVDISRHLTDDRSSQGHSIPDSASRPTTTGNKSQFTSGSRSHVASLRSPAFFQPMSSQRLQTQRGVRPNSAMAHTRDDSLTSDEYDDAQSNTQRHSVGSTQQTRRLETSEGLHTQYLEDEATVPPTSRGSQETERTDWQHERQATNRGLINGNTLYQAAESMDTFHDTNETQKSITLDPEKTYTPAQAPGPINSRNRSPRAFVSAFRRKSEQDSPKPNGHEKLSSRDSASLRKPHLQGQDKQSRNLGKNWEYFDGNVMFFLGGRLQTAKDKPIVVGTGLAVVVPSVLFFIFVAPWSWHHISPAIPIVYAYLFFVTMSSFFHACFSDPGVLPRNLHPFPPEGADTDPLALGPPTTSWTMVLTGKKQPGAFEVPTKYCKTCSIWRPPRCHHCRVCDTCVDTQDHHCVWLNNCVGRRNYRYFYVFVGGAAAMAIFLFGSSIGQITRYASIHDVDFVKALRATTANRVAFFLFFYGLLAFAYPTALWGYHAFLIARGITTREYLISNKFLKKDRHRPFNQKPFWRNFIVVLLRPRGPSAVEFKKPYHEGDQRFREQRGFQRKRSTTRNTQADGGQVELQRLDMKSGRGFQDPKLRGMLNRTSGSGSTGKI